MSTKMNSGIRIKYTQPVHYDDKKNNKNIAQDIAQLQASREKNLLENLGKKVVSMNPVHGNGYVKIAIEYIG